MPSNRNVSHVGQLAATILAGLAAVGCAGAGTTPSSFLPTPAPSSGSGVIEYPWELPATPTYEQLVPLFAYHSTVPFDVKENGVHVDGGATVRDITYMGEAGQPVDAFLVVPSGSGPFPAVLFEHGMGETRDTFIDEAVALAQAQHVVGLVPTRPITPANSGTDEAILQMREMRHGFDLLVSQPGVDASRLGYAGFSMGAVIGSEIVAFEPRIKTAVLIEGVPNVAQNWLDTAVLAPHVANASLFFQFGSGDTNYNTDDANAWAALYKGSTQVKWYASGHAPSQEFMDDATAWFSTNL